MACDGGGGGGGSLNYSDFVARKLAANIPTGLADAEPRPEYLFPFQVDLVRWALRRGRAAIFADTGLGKTRMQLEWAHQIVNATDRPALILSPLAVAEQTAEEGERIGVKVTVCRDGSEVSDGISITNYERLHRFDTSKFGAVVLDESSCIKHHDAKTFSQLIEAFNATPFRLCATATPSPNDYTELGQHAEFLGICRRVEMLSEFFVHDGGETQVWRLKGHARPVFWRWVSTWGALVRKPSDLGYGDEGYSLPSLHVSRHVIEAGEEEARAAGVLFVQHAASLMDRRRARNASVGGRVEKCAAMVNADSKEKWIVWCDLNAESDALTKAIDGAIEVRGSQSIEEKERRIHDFIHGSARVLVSKCSITGFGLNLQFCARMAFVGVTDSWEAYYQAVRRCYRFGQARSVEVHIFSSEAEGSVVENLRRKEREAEKMAEELSRETRGAVRDEVLGQHRTVNEYNPTRPMETPEWLVSETA